LCRIVNFTGRSRIESLTKQSFRIWSQSIFPNLSLGVKFHILVGNDNGHMSAPTMNIIKAMEEPQSYPYAALTPLGWCVAGPTLPPVRNDPVLNLMVKTVVNKCREDFRSKISKAQTQAESKGADGQLSKRQQGQSSPSSQDESWQNIDYFWPLLSVSPKEAVLDSLVKSFLDG
jgi:hypothetical protein